ncbi:MAG: hypothetical protein QOF48_2343 [Verrucomicrobiota bacterium]|jgi:hypothetical protein
MTADADRSALAARVEAIVASTPVMDIHTHLYDPAFGDLLLWGIDDLLVYHYLVSESFRWLDMPYEKFWALPKASQAELIWDTLFLQHSPISEACRGVLTSLHQLGLDVKKRDLSTLRRWFAQWKPAQYVTRCLELANVKSICMTNSPFDEIERPRWEKKFRRDPRFISGLRIDPLLISWGDTAPLLARWSYKTGGSLTPKTTSEVRRFLDTWTRTTDARYLMVSLPPDFDFPADTNCARVLEKAVLPHCRDAGLPLALMMGVKRAVNPRLRMAGDGVGLSNLAALERLCDGFPQNKFAVTVLARENQHELCVLARKFRNLHIFGCWWFTNIPTVVEEMTRMRLELIGLSVTPQHSDARVVDQLLYKWQHFRSILATVLTDKYADLAATGWPVSDEDIRRDVSDLLGGAFDKFCKS